MFEQLSDFINKLLGLKKNESPEARIVRLKSLVKTEVVRTKALQEKVRIRKETEELQKKIIEERQTQERLYSDLGTDSPQVRKQKNTRMLVILGIALIFLLVIAKSCFK